MTSQLSFLTENIPDDIMARWQDIVDIMARVIKVPAAIIARIDAPTYEVLLVNAQNTLGIEAGAQLSLSDVYCETVYKSRKPLLIGNALEQEQWKNHPEVSHGYISYLGYPIILPNGEVFGTICVLDIKQNEYSEEFKKIILLFKDQIESHLQLLCIKMSLEQQVDQHTDELKETNEKLLREIKERKNAHIALKQSEARFRNVLENSLVGIAISRNGQLIYQNPEYLRIIGIAPDGSEFPYLVNIHPEDVEFAKSQFQPFSGDQTATFEGQFRFYPFGSARKARDIKWIHCRATHVREHKTPALLINVIDITRMKELELMLRIEDNMRSLGRVASGITHELRNPLSAIKMFVRALQDSCSKTAFDEDGSSNTSEAVILQIQEAANRIERTINKVRDFAKPSIPQSVMVNLNQCIEKTVDLAAQAIKEHGVDVGLTLDANLPVCLADPLLIENAILNLVCNAVEVLRDIQGPRKLAISSAATKDALFIRVADSGPGVSEEIRDMIFAPFFTTKSDGAGIGLSIAHRIVEDHGGTMDVSTSLWGGAEFAIKLPRANQGVMVKEKWDLLKKME